MLNIRVIERKNPQDEAQAPKYYGHAIANGIVDLEKMAYLIANQCTVREADCYAVLIAMQRNMLEQLSEGKIVKLDMLGSFQIGVKTEGQTVAEDFNEAAIKSAHLNFRATKKMKKQFRTLDYTIEPKE